MQDLNHDLVVIGGGIIGVTCGWQLTQAGYKVLLLEKSEIGQGASFGNAGHIATEQVLPLASPAILRQLPRMLLDPLGPLRLDWRYLPRIVPWLLRLVVNMRSQAQCASSAGLRSLNEASLSAWQQLLKQAGLSHLLKEDGSLLVCESDAAFAELLHHIETLKQLGVQGEPWSASLLHQRIPGLAPAISGGIFFPATGHVLDPYQLVIQLFTQAQAAGLVHMQAEVYGGRCLDDGIELNTCKGKLLAKRVLVAAGAWAKPLVRELAGINIPLDTERGYHLMLPAEPDRLPMAISSLERRFIMTPMAGGLRLAGTVEFAGLHKAPDYRRAQGLLRHADALFERQLDTEGASPWMGCRPSLPDSLPVIDRVGPQGRLLLALGHHHLGLTQAAITAQLIQSLLSGTPSGLDTTPYRLARFGQLPPTHNFNNSVCLPGSEG
ncbi:FAD dependent oxidoreductase [Oceanimonas sp. GK1]|uniref:NAD(P)/FAD-dependent oxidoreductase n=1 Tax=Oceanimonas sp. (strain GK1 / IBRC-M 10197) TaxID=511062 RepID=UPI0002494CDC|nr:FAD-dependent oxidoreductase [Oceanimonas sp. GK1]AEY00273.1 FAD dependent oxidoreductase [Oceanimonas sp. GK1]